MKRASACILALALHAMGCAGEDASGSNAPETELDEANLAEGAPDPCANPPAKPARQGSIVFIQSKSGSKVTGTAVLAKNGRGVVTLSLSVNGAPPGEHGVHLHEKGDCSAADATSAGGHWNPNNQPHGKPGTPSHAGDLGNMTVDANGRGRLTFSNKDWKLGDGSPLDLLNHAIIIHEKPDDFTTQPTGNAGARLGCGVIR